MSEGRGRADCESSAGTSEQVAFRTSQGEPSLRCESKFSIELQAEHLAELMH